MKEVYWRLGGEQSGHVIDRHWLPTGDGLKTMVSVMNALVATAQPLSHWNDQLERYPQVLHNIDVEEKPPLETLPRTRSQIGEVEDELGREGRVLVRYSGTEPVVRIMLEGRDRDRLQKLAAGIAEIMKDEVHKDEVK
jgi:phosphoglucosamine mutase